MYSEDSFVTITATAFTNNLAQGAVGVNGAIVPTGAFATGGGLDSYGDALTITGSTFRGNQAVGGEAGTSGGGGVSIGGSSIGGALVYTAGQGSIDGVIVNGTASVSQSVFEDNQAIGGAGQGFQGGSATGAAIDVGGTPSSSGPAMTISQTTIKGNIATGGCRPGHRFGRLRRGCRHR